MNTKKFLNNFKQALYEAIDTKTSWGKNELKKMLDDVFIQQLIKEVSEDE